MLINSGKERSSSFFSVSSRKLTSFQLIATMKWFLLILGPAKYVGNSEDYKSWLGKKSVIIKMDYSNGLPENFDASKNFENNRGQCSQE